MSIPIGQLQANDISVPISLYHHGGSLRVAEGEDDCGLGWSLATGGFIARMVRGLPDEVNLPTRKGWLHNNNAQSIQNFSPSANDDLTNCTDEVADYNWLNGMVGESVNDTEPDIFYINAPGLSAQFVFGIDGLPKLLIHQDIIIEYASGYFTVKANGKIYTFNSVETTNRSSTIGNNQLVNAECRYYNTAISFVTRWRLTNITSLASGTQAHFLYTQLPEIRSRSYTDIDSLNFVEDKITPSKISLITLKSYSASFTWLNDLLTKVSITESQTADKLECQLVYQSISSPETYPVIPVTKSLLTKVLLSNNSPFQMYEFEYNDLSQEAWRKNWRLDFFGYYNGVTTNRNDPTLYFYSSESDGKRLRTTPIPGGSPIQVPGQDRSVNTQLNASGALKKIILPTGGRVLIEYEANTYIDNSTTQEFAGGGVRVKRLISQGGEIAFGKRLETANAYRAITKEYEYKLTNNSSSGVLLSPVKLGYITSGGIKKSVTSLGEDPEVLYSRVVEKISGQGSRVWEFSIPGVFPETTNGSWKATKSRIARKPGASCLDVGNIKNGYYTYPYAPSTNYNYKRGFLTRTSEYSEAGTLVREKNFTPIELTAAPGLLKGLRFELHDNIFQYGVYEMLTGRVQVVGTEVTREASEENPTLWMQTTTQYTYNANNMLQEVTTTLPDNTVTINRMKYAKDFQYTNPVSTDTMAVALKKLNDTYRQGEIVEQIAKVTIPGVSQTVSSTLITYRDFGSNRVLPYYIKALPVGAVLTESTMSGQNFSADTDYITLRTLKEYDSESRLLTEFDDKRNYTAYHHALDPSFTIATFSGAKAQQAIYESFEFQTSFGLILNGSGWSYPLGWTGEKAIQFTNSSAALISSPSKLIQKGGDDYRVSCWVYAEANKTITVSAKAGATVVSLVLTNLQNNAWNYIEGKLNLASITTPFTLEVSTDATLTQPVILDDFVFIPAVARVALKTSKPLTGVTSTTDDRGNSVKYTYDDAKRLVHTYNRNRDMVSKNEYKTAITPPSCVLNANFSKSVSEIISDVPVSFTAGATCGSAIIYNWEVDGVMQPSTTNILTTTFSVPGAHNVKLTVTDVNFGSATFTETICVKVSPTIEVEDNFGNPVNTSTQVFDCNSTNATLTFSVNGLGSLGSDLRWFERRYDNIRHEYYDVPILNGNQQYVTGSIYTTLISAPITIVAITNISSPGCPFIRVELPVTINYNSTAVCN
ncbi:MAG: hypothetical protein EBR30_06765 [Cytophagia bacterium]|nr:hypothetical protein [Cytophagia bacterium]